MSDLLKEAKAKLQDMFDGDNQHTNIIDSIEDSMIGKSGSKKIDDVMKDMDEKFGTKKE